MAGTFDVFPGWTGGDKVLFSDFDDGTAAHDAFGLFFGLNGLGQGADEVSTSSGDSGGPSFINGQIAGVTSFGIRVFFSTAAVRTSMNSPIRASASSTLSRVCRSIKVGPIRK